MAVQANNGWIADVLNGYKTVQQSGAALTQRNSINLTGGLVASDNVTNQSTDISLATTAVRSVTEPAFGAKADGIQVSDGAITSGTPNLACATSTPFTAASVGKTVAIPGAGAAGIPLITTILAFVDSGHVTLAANAGTTIASGGTVNFGTDNGPKFQAAATALAGTGITMLIPVGTYLVGTTVVLPSQLNIQANPGVRLIGAIAQGSPTNAIFLAQPGAVTTSAKFSANNVIGTTTVSSNTSIPVGSIVQLSVHGTFRANMYIVTGLSGAGPFTLTLDRPVLYQFTSGNSDDIFVVPSIPQDIHIFGGGMSMSGPTVRYVEIVSGRNCSIEDVKVDTVNGVASDFVFSFDTGNYRCAYKRCSVTGACGTSAFVWEAAESGWAEDCVAVGLTGANGYQFYDGVNCELRNCKATTCLAGVVWNAQGDNQGSNWCRIVGGNFDDNSSYGISVTNGTTFCNFTDFTANYNGAVGVILDGTGAAMAGNKIANFTAQGNATYGVQVLAGAKDTVIDNCDVSSNGSIGILCQDDTVIGNVRSKATNGASVIGVGAGVVFVSGLKCSDTNNSSTNFMVNVTGGKLYLTNADILMGQANYGLVTSGTAFVSVSQSVFGPAGASGAEHGILPNSAGSTIFMGEGCDVTACANPLPAPVGTLQMSQGQGVFTAGVTTGTTTCSQVQAKANALRTTGALTGAVTINVPAGIPGLSYDCEALGTGFNTLFGVTGGTAITVATGKRARCKSDGTNMQRVGPDT